MQGSNLLWTHLQQTPASLLPWEDVEVRLGDLCADDVQHYVYFMCSGLSVFRSSDGRRGVQTSFLGRYSSSGLFLGHALVPTTLQRSTAWRIPRDLLQQEARNCRSVASLMVDDNNYIVGQIAKTLTDACGIRLVRRVSNWLAEAHRQSGMSRLHICHHQIAELLGTRRAGVTDSLIHLEGLQLIKSLRGVIEIRDAPNLERFGASLSADAPLPARTPVVVGGAAFSPSGLFFPPLLAR